MCAKPCPIFSLCYHCLVRCSTQLCLEDLKRTFEDFEAYLLCFYAEWLCPKHFMIFHKLTCPYIFLRDNSVAKAAMTMDFFGQHTGGPSFHSCGPPKRPNPESESLFVFLDCGVFLLSLSLIVLANMRNTPWRIA